MQITRGLRALAIISVFVLCFGCVTKETSSSPFSRAGAAKGEPNMIALRNATPQMLRMITVRETVDDPTASQRLGRVEPAPAGTSAFFQRPSNRQALPERAVVEWVTINGVAMSWEVDVAGALHTATGASDEILVFEVRTNGSATCYVTVDDR